jgi:ADP-heptose:LPS heptosyltransferase
MIDCADRLAPWPLHRQTPGPIRSVAIVKPDHIGDLILSTPAIRAVGSRFDHVTLFCHPNLISLARRLHPGISLAPIILPHLQKRSEHGCDSFDPSVLNEFDAVLFLRNDNILEMLASELSSTTAIVENEHHRHETALQQEATERITGPYNRAELFHEQKGLSFPDNPARIGLCISAGFTNNCWPTVYWLELAALLLAKSIEVFIIGGPLEVPLLSMLASCLRLGSQHVIQGDPHYRFLDTIRSLDLVIASDSGTAHLCSMVVAILSIFGPSSFRRFAPFGNHNRVLTLDLKCSPCSQFHPHILNTCHSRECLSLIKPRHILAALDYAMINAPSNPSVVAEQAVKMYVSVSSVFS